MGAAASYKVISMSKGGGALACIGDKFSPNLYNSTSNFTIPIALPLDRNGFQPSSSLIYSTGTDNDLFGLGWNLGIPGISRKSYGVVPLYNEAICNLNKGERRDVFIPSCAEDLVPVSSSLPEEVVYRPRTEGPFARIAHHQPTIPNSPSYTLIDYWRVESKNEVESTYSTRVLDNPFDGREQTQQNKKIFAWRRPETCAPLAI